MKRLLFKGGALSSAFITAFCWQFALVLASLGLGSLTFAVWLAKYRWIFMLVTFVFLGLAFRRTYRDRQKVGKWGISMLYGTTALSVGLILFAIIYR